MNVECDAFGSLSSGECAHILLTSCFLPYKVHRKQQAVLDYDQQAMLLQCSRKSDIVAFLTPHFERVLCKQNVDFVVVNSENCIWPEKFEDGGSYIDLFICHKAFYQRKDTLSVMQRDAKVRCLSRLEATQKHRSCVKRKGSDRRSYVS
jgi:hypothetical protein